MTVSQTHSVVGPRDAANITFDAKDCLNLEAINKMGLGLDEAMVDQMMDQIGMDALTDLATTAGIPTPVQFLQAWLPGHVKTNYAARNIDEFIGRNVVGSWEDEEIVQAILEPTGKPVLYGDYTNVPLTSWNQNFERRTVVRFEQGMRVGRLEEARAGRARVNTAAEKREAASLNLEIQRNSIGFYGLNSGDNRTYGFLNDPSLPSYVNVPNGSGGDSEWSTKTFLEITADLRTAFAALRTQSKGRIDPMKDKTTLALATSVVDRLTVTSDYGNSVREWLTKTYPNCRIVSAPELDEANGGDNVFYLYAENVNDNSTDGGQTFIQVVPTLFTVLGVQQLAKGYEEDYTNASAGTMCKRPYAVVRYSGV